MSPHLPDVDLFNALATVGAGSLVIWAWVAKIGPLVKRAWKGIRRFFHIVDEALGIEGDPERPGLLAEIKTTKAVALAVHAQVFPNGGSSLRDVVNKQAEQWQVTSAQLVTIAATQEQVAATQEVLAQGLENSVVTQEQRTVQVAQLVQSFGELSASLHAHVASHGTHQASHDTTDVPARAKRAPRIPKQRPA